MGPHRHGHALRARRSRAALQIFIDGTLSTSASGFAPSAYDTAPLRAGCRGDGANAFDGMLDEVRLYNRVLTNAELQTLAQ